jgi:hypothetical protein
MSVTSSRNVQIELSGDIESHIIQSALDNITSPGQIDVITLIVGDNTITAPVISGLASTALTIIPPAGNTSVMILKGVALDTGVPIHVTDPTSIGLDSSFVSLVITVTVAIVGVRLIWS